MRLMTRPGKNILVSGYFTDWKGLSGWKQRF